MKRNGKFQIWATIGGFIGLLFVPGLVWSIWGSVIGGDTGENRTLAEKPELTLQSIESFPSKYSEYWNDHVPFRNLARSAWVRLNYFVLDDSPSDNVVLGKSGNDDSDRWLFYAKKKDNSPVADAQGVTSYSEEIMEKASSAFRASVEHFKKSGREFYMFIAPNKVNMYKEYLPDSIEIYEEESRGEKLLDKLKSDGLTNIIYAKDELLAAKELGQLYNKQDTHWNELGAFYGFRALMKVMEPGFDDFDYSVRFLEPQISSFDLAKMIGLEDYFTDSWVRLSYHTERSFSEQKVEQEGRGNVNYVVTTNENAPIYKTVMVVGDSYSNALYPYLAKTYTKVIILHREGYKEKMLDEYDPDIVVAEAVERYLSVMAGYRFGE